MADLKRTKRVRDAESDVTLEDLIDDRRRRLVREREAIPALRQRMQSLLDRVASLTARHQFRERHDCVERAEALRREIDVLASMRREHDFERTVVAYLRMYHAPEPAVRTDGGGVASKNDAIKALAKESGRVSQHRAVIMDEYLSEMNQAPAKVAMATRDECPRCDVKLLLAGSRSIMSCPTCGYSVTYLDATSTSTSFDEVVEYSQYCTSASATT